MTRKVRRSPAAVRPVGRTTRRSVSRWPGPSTRVRTPSPVIRRVTSRSPRKKCPLRPEHLRRGQREAAGARAGVPQPDLGGHPAVQGQVVPHPLHDGQEAARPDEGPVGRADQQVRSRWSRRHRGCRGDPDHVGVAAHRAVAVAVDGGHLEGAGARRAGVQQRSGRRRGRAGHEVGAAAVRAAVVRTHGRTHGIGRTVAPARSGPPPARTRRGPALGRRGSCPGRSASRAATGADRPGRARMRWRSAPLPNRRGCCRCRAGRPSR